MVVSLVFWLIEKKYQINVNLVKNKVVVCIKM